MALFALSVVKYKFVPSGKCVVLEVAKFILEKYKLVVPSLKLSVVLLPNAMFAWSCILPFATLKLFSASFSRPYPAIIFADIAAFTLSVV